MDRIGRYKVVRELGRGAMGIVYHAIDPNIGRPVAIKTIQLGGKPDEVERMRERLFREARSAGILSHPGIVTIYDVDQQGELAYIAMEYVDGPTLDQLMAPGETLSPERIFGVLAQTAAALDYAHQKGIVHRDIKPANVMIAADGTVKITDFGIAKITASDQFTMTGSIVGTPHYMSPEQVQGQPVDGRSDQFSLAVMAFEMLTGDKPYTGEHLTTVVYKIVADEPPVPHRLNPTLSAGIDAVLRKALSKKPDARYATAQEFVDALEKACAATKGWKAMPRGGGLSEPTAVEAPRPAMNLPAPRRPARSDDGAGTAERSAKRKSGFLTFVLASLVAAGLLALIGWQADPQLPQKMQGLAQKVQVALGMANPPRPAVPASQQPPPNPTANPTPAISGDMKPSPMPGLTPATPVPSPTEGTQPAAAPAPPDAAPVKPAEAKTESPPVLAARPAPSPRNTLPAPAGPKWITIVSSPGGATATLDGHPDPACTTPCSLQGTPGRHTVTITLAGYEPEHRDVTVATSSVELPPVVLRAPSGTLMVTSVPDGAAISLNGRRLPQTTPAQIPLSPGTYKILVEKDGRQASSSVEIRNSITSYLRITLE